MPAAEGGREGGDPSCSAPGPTVLARKSATSVAAWGASLVEVARRGADSIPDSTDASIVEGTVVLGRSAPGGLERKNSMELPTSFRGLGEHVLLT